MRGSPEERRRNGAAPTRTCVIIGSFRQHYRPILNARRRLQRAGVAVLSPAQSEILDPDEAFVVLRSDLDEGAMPGIRLLEDTVLAKIRESDFVYVCNPRGYIGLSTAFEIGFANALGKPVIAMNAPEDPLLLHYVDDVAAPAQAVALLFPSLPEGQPDGNLGREEEPMIGYQATHTSPADSR